MIVGYVFENALGLILAVSIWHLRRRAFSRDTINSHRTQVGLQDRWIDVVARGCSSFYDSAIVFAFAIQIASIVVLARLNFGATASGMGDSTARITWSISLLTLIPLMYVVCMPRLLRGQQDSANGLERKQEPREKLRFLLFTVCCLLFQYPLFSRMISMYGPSLIGTGPHQVVSTSDWNTIETTCIPNDVRSITNAESMAMSVFGVGGSLFISLFIVIKLVWLAAQKQHGDVRLVQSIRNRYSKSSFRGIRWSAALFIFLPVLAISQIWTILRLRQQQLQISKAAGNPDLDGEWTFGQVAAMTIFMPVLVECWYTWVYH